MRGTPHNITKAAVETAALYISLVYDRGKYLNSKHSWFYSLVSLDQLDHAQDVVDPDDLYQEILLYSLELYSKFDGKDYKFPAILRKYVPRFVRDYLTKETNHANTRHWGSDRLSDLGQPTEDHPSSIQEIDLRWVTKRRLDIPTYMRYILYLKYVKDLTYEEISTVLYETSRSVKTSVKQARELYKQVYN